MWNWQGSSVDKEGTNLGASCEYHDTLNEYQTITYFLNYKNKYIHNT